MAVALFCNIKGRWESSAQNIDTRKDEFILICEQELKKLIKLSWLELDFSGPLYEGDLDTGRLIIEIPEGDTEKSLVEKRRQEQAEHGLILK